MIDSYKAEVATGALMTALGLDWEENPHMRDTPRRVASMYGELTRCLHDNPPDLRLFPNDEKYDQIVISGPIQFYSLCEHHLVPFFGKAYVAYIPSKEIIGVSKLSRTVDHFASKPTTQERMSHEVVKHINGIGPVGAACIIKGRHLCMEMRGVRKPGSVMITSTLKGVFDVADKSFKAHAKDELLQLVARCENGV